MAGDAEDEGIGDPDADFYPVAGDGRRDRKRLKERVRRIQKTALARGEMQLVSRGGVEFTEDGMVTLYDNLRSGATEDEICDYFTIDVDTYRKLISEGGQCHHIFRRASAELRIQVRRAQLNMAHVNASAAKLVGTHVLGQGNEPPPEDQKKSVVGSMPDFEATPDDWAHQFAPRQVSNASTIEQIRAENEAKKRAEP